MPFFVSPNGVLESVQAVHWHLVVAQLPQELLQLGDVPAVRVL